MNFLPLEQQPVTILKRIAAGEPTAVEDCIKQYGRLIWGLAKKYSVTREDAEDAVQEIFTEIWQNAARFDEQKAKEITFIALIARRRLIDRVRRVYRRPNVHSLEEVFVTAGYESAVYKQIEAKQAVKVMNGLRTEQREMMYLNIYEGMSHGEIADRTGIPLGTVKTHIRRGFKRVRDAMSYKFRKDSNAITA
ncbi:MAG: sigma-70 family RNA polymerase sigma factor [Pyrinomonadaceae bacterium]|nr:sigma-70 family RNA polymerase sigma factor [Pyrinomonadaceae bacterium]